MAVCKRCGGAIPLGLRDCPFCSRLSLTAAGSSETGPVVGEVSSDYPVTWGAATARGSLEPELAPEIKKGSSRLRFAWVAAAALGALSAGVGLIAELGSVRDLLGAHVNWGTVVEGLVYLVLAFFIRRRSQLALAVTTALYGLDAIAYLLSGHVSVTFVLIRIGIFAAFVQAFSAINQLKEFDARSAGTTRTQAA